MIWLYNYKSTLILLQSVPDMPALPIGIRCIHYWRAGCR